MTENNRPARDNRPAARARRVLRSEGLAATVFLALTGVFVAVLGASGWWTLETHRKMLEESRARQVEVVARLLADNAETAMAGGGVSTLRRIVTDAALEHRLSSCRLAFADGRVLADGNPRAVKDASVPETWPQRSAPAAGSKNIADGVVAVRVPIEVPGKGSLDLTVEAGIAYPLWAETEAQLGIGVLHRNLSIEEQVTAVRAVKRFESGMVVNPITIRPDQTLADAQELMARNRISGIPVVEASGRLVGILTNRDVRFAENPAQPVAEL